MNKVFKEAFKTSIPILLGYLSIGFAFGIMIESIGLNAIWAGLMSLTIYGGTLQYLAVDFFKSGLGFINVAIMSFLVNFRHLVYGLSLLQKYKGINPLKKFYMIFALTDETYALVTSPNLPENIKEEEAENYYFFISILDQLYWIIGSIIGATFGALMNINTKGVSFAMIALFCVLCTEQWENRKENKIPVILGGVCAICSLLLFGANNMIIPSIVALIIILLLKKKLDDEKIPLNQEGSVTNE